MVNSVQHSPALGTLHVLAAFPSQWQRTLAELRQLWTPQDQLVLLADGAQGWPDPDLQAFGTVSILDTDAAQLALPDPMPAYLEVISAAQWSSYILSYPRCLMWR